MITVPAFTSELVSSSDIGGWWAVEIEWQLFGPNSRIQQAKIIWEAHEACLTPSEADDSSGRKRKFCMIWLPSLPKNNFKNVFTLKTKNSPFTLASPLKGTGELSLRLLQSSSSSARISNTSYAFAECFPGFMADRQLGGSSGNCLNTWRIAGYKHEYGYKVISVANCSERAPQFSIVS